MKITSILLLLGFLLLGCDNCPQQLTDAEYTELNLKPQHDCFIEPQTVRTLIEKRNATIKELEAKLALVKKDGEEWKYALERVNDVLTNCNIEKKSCIDDLAKRPLPGKRCPECPTLPPVFHCGRDVNIGGF